MEAPMTIDKVWSSDFGVVLVGIVVELWMLGEIPMIYETLNSPSFPSTMAF